MGYRYTTALDAFRYRSKPMHLKPMLVAASLALLAGCEEKFRPRPLSSAPGPGPGPFTYPKPPPSLARVAEWERSAERMADADLLAALLVTPATQREAGKGPGKCLEIMLREAQHRGLPIPLRNNRRAASRIERAA